MCLYSPSHSNEQCCPLFDKIRQRILPALMAQIDIFVCGNRYQSPQPLSYAYFKRERYMGFVIVGAQRIFRPWGEGCLSRSKRRTKMLIRFRHLNNIFCGSKDPNLPRTYMMWASFFFYILGEYLNLINSQCVFETFLRNLILNQ